MQKLLITMMVVIIFPVCGWGATYYVRNNGTAANAAAASGPCSDASASMNRTVYAGETFAEADVIIFCGVPKPVGELIFLKGQRRYVIPSATANDALLLEGGSDYLLLEGGTDKLLLE